jgi:hypothetical protein
MNLYITNKLNPVACVRERTILTERPPLVGEVGAKFADRGCHVVSVTDPYGRILGFLHRIYYELDDETLQHFTVFGIMFGY